MEIEADYIGILLLAAAGIHPHWALVAMEKRARLERGSALRYILSNHPNPKKQLQLLSKDKTMKEAMELYREATAMDKVTDRYFR
jgi:predicted Zn-dependent protease